MLIKVEIATFAMGLVEFQALVPHATGQGIDLAPTYQTQ